jgi:hypothetical protein
VTASYLKAALAETAKCTGKAFRVPAVNRLAASPNANALVGSGRGTTEGQRWDGVGFKAAGVGEAVFLLAVLSGEGQFQLGIPDRIQPIHTEESISNQ